MIILGISAFYHDSAACLIKNGKILSALEEERFSRKKHDNAFPFEAIKKCLEINNLNIGDIDYIAYYEKPLLKFERILETFIETWPYSLKPFLKSIPEWLGGKIRIESLIKKKLGFVGKIFFIPHHLSHASAAFLTSPFKQSAVLTIDGVGDVPTTGMWSGKQNIIKCLGEINFPHSLGLFYSTWTAFLGFKVNSDEYKVMGLSAYGKPIYKNQILKLIHQFPDGSFELDLSYFDFRNSFRMWGNKFEKTFGKPRQPMDSLTTRHKNLASSLQAVTEEIYLKILNKLHEKTGSRNLCLSGGVALNSLANGKIYNNTKFKKIYILGPAGDSGASLGAALYLYTNILGKKRPAQLKNLYLGTSYSDRYIKSVLDSKNIRYKQAPNIRNLIKKTATLLANGKIVGWFQGKMEFGPRALGSRSILANPKKRVMKNLVNKIKHREQFRPFAGSVLQEKADRLFEVPEKNHYSPFMNFCFITKRNARTKIASIVHKDKTCRIQTVNRDNGIYYHLINKFYRLTKIPCVLNTSYNLSFEPIIEKPEHAIDDFLNTNIDALVIGKFVLEK